ncbi:MAG TPA: SMC-Scp complex subunit ScpB [Chloroflexi bacterium]|nr:SMC-Scp complex subunit ScpB [Chloroflexota bacterium]
MMELEEAKEAIEALLFVAGEPVTLEQLMRTLEVERELVEGALRSLVQEYEGRGLRIQRERDEAQMVTAPECADYVERFLGLQFSGKLSTAALETLAIVAYRQPITRAQVEEIRGVNCEGVLRNLVARGLVEELGRLDRAGRPIIYGTTFEFLQYFGLSDLTELPQVEEVADS